MEECNRENGPCETNQVEPTEKLGTLQYIIACMNALSG